jgi:hypothetical protein
MNLQFSVVGSPTSRRGARVTAARTAIQLDLTTTGPVA